MTASPSQEGSCWNGTTIGNFSSENVQFEPPASPEVLTEQLNVLQVLSHTMQAAFHGQEVELPETDDEDVIASGSGSGEKDLVDQEGGDVIDPEEDDLFEPEIIETTTLRRLEPTFRESTDAPPRSAVPIDSAAAIPKSFNSAITSYLLPVLLLLIGRGFNADLL